MKILEQLKSVLSLAKKINCEITSNNEEVNVIEIDKYLIELEAWQANYASITEDVIDEFVKLQLKECLRELEMEHGVLISKANILMKEVKQELSNVNKTSRGLKKYIDSPGFQSKGLFKKG